MEKTYTLYKKDKENNGLRITIGQNKLGYFEFFAERTSHKHPERISEVYFFELLTILYLIHKDFYVHPEKSQTNILLWKEDVFCEEVQRLPAKKDNFIQKSETSLEVSDQASAPPPIIQKQEKKEMEVMQLLMKKRSENLQLDRLNRFMRRGEESLFNSYPEEKKDIQKDETFENPTKTKKELLFENSLFSEDPFDLIEISQQIFEETEPEEEYIGEDVLLLYHLNRKTKAIQVKNVQLHCIYNKEMNQAVFRGINEMGKVTISELLKITKILWDIISPQKDFELQVPEGVAIKTGFKSSTRDWFEDLVFAGQGIRIFDPIEGCFDKKAVEKHSINKKIGRVEKKEEELPTLAIL